MATELRGASMQISIAFPEKWTSVEILKKELQTSVQRAGAGSAVQVRSHEGRVLETAIIVAAISGGATVIAAVIQAVAAVAGKRKAKTLTITGRHGGRIELPLDASTDQIDRAARAVESMQDPELKVE